MLVINQAILHVENEARMLCRRGMVSTARSMDMYWVWALLWRVRPPGRDVSTVLTLTSALALASSGAGNGVVAFGVVAVGEACGSSMGSVLE